MGEPPAQGVVKEGAWLHGRSLGPPSYSLSLQGQLARLCAPFSLRLFLCSFIAVENIDSYCVLISSKAVYFLKSGDYLDREAIFLEVKYDDLYHCLTLPSSSCYFGS